MSLIACGKPAKHNGFRPGTNNLNGGTSNGPAAPNSGGEDLGGGNTKGSNDKFITEILTNKTKLQKELEDIIRNFDPRQPFLAKDLAFVLKWNSKYNASKIDLAKIMNQIHLENVCMDKNGELKAAAVKEFKISSDICISKKALSEIPSESLRKQIHLLLLHEISHLIGFLETDAEKMQSITLAHYGYLFLDNSKTALKEIFIQHIVSAKVFLKELATQPDQFFTNGAILKSDKFFENYSTKNRLISPSLIKSAEALLANLENQSQENSILNVDQIRMELNKVRLLPYNLDQMISWLTVSRDGSYPNPFITQHPEVKNGNYLFVKKEFQKALALLENIDFIKDDYAKAFWENEEQRVANSKFTPKPLAP